MKKLFLILVLMMFSSAALAECYPASAGNANVPGCAQVDSYVNANGKSQPRNTAATYSVQINDVTPAATATDVLCVTGSASKTVKVSQVQITADATGAAVLDFYIYKRTAANTGGTATHPSVVMMDSSDAAASATVNLYSANPSALGTGVLLAGDHYEIPATTGTAYYSVPWIEYFGRANDKQVVLHGAGEQVCFSLNGQTLPSGTSVYTRIVWTEE
jgi:hypothetical protein